MQFLLYKKDRDNREEIFCRMQLFTIDLTVGCAVVNIVLRWHQDSLFLSVLNQQMAAEIELKAFNQIGQGNCAATLGEIQLIKL